MQIEIGKNVIASDGEKLGSVDRLVMDNETHNLRKFVVHKGVFWPEDRIVDLDLVSEIDSEGNVHLRVPSDDEYTMPRFVEDTFTAADEQQVTHMGYGSLWGAAPYAPIWFSNEAETTHRPSGEYDPGDRPFFDVAEATPAPVETRTNLPEDTFTLDSGTDVVGSDGDKVGEVDEVIFDEQGNPTGFVVKAGFIFKHDIRIPIDAVDHMSGAHVALRMTGHQAEEMYTE